MQQHSKSQLLTARLTECQDFVGAWSATIYRASTTRYANSRDLMTGVGSRKTGDRWNAPGQFRCVHGSLQPETALAEALANYREYGIPESEAMPLVFVGIELRLQAVLDLTSEQVLQILKLSKKKLVAEPWKQLQSIGQEALTQAIGRLAVAARFEALIVPSARRLSGQNLVLFPGRRLPGSSWRVVHPRQLPRISRSN